MTATAASIDALRGVLPAERSVAPDAYALDGVTPVLAFRPDTREEVARLVAAADAAGLAIAPLGARTQAQVGRPLEAYDIALDTTALDRVVTYEPDDLTVTIEAGMTLARLQQVLGERGQYLPADVPPSDAVTVGGLLATARPGAWRGHVPGQRDLILGITAALPSGELVHSGGRVVKNVSGYDVHRMHTGALGAYGVIVEATFKLAPLPPGTRSFAVRCASLAQAADLAFTLWDQALPLRALSLLAPAAAQAAGLEAVPHILLECMGSDAVLDRCERAVRAEAALASVAGGEIVSAEPWTALRALAGSPDCVVLRLGVPPSHVAATIEAVTVAGCTAWGHLAPGSVLAHASGLGADAVTAMRGHATRLGGFLQVESAPAALRRAVDPFDTSERELVRSLKQQFDPRGTLNRGRWQEGV